MYIRCARGRFSADRYEAVAKRLDDVQKKLAPAIRTVPGLIDYYAGIDRASNTTMSVSIWDTAEHATALETLPAAVTARNALAKEGVEWDDFATFTVSWWVQPV